jgi:hypothetical protein
MLTRCRLLGFVAVVAGVGALVGADAPPGRKDAEHRLEELRGQPAAYERMRLDLLAFYELSPERRNQIRSLHQAIQDKDPEVRQKLLEGLERYADWRERLSEEERQQIDSAPDKTERLKVIRRLREEQRLRNWHGPSRFKDYPENVKQFFDRHIRRHLSSDESEQLSNADGDGRAVARLLLELAKRHPYFPPPIHGPGPPVPGSHACKPEQFSLEVRGFLRDELIPRLSESETKQLENAVGKWPQYPELLHKLAQEHHLLIPGLSLPLSDEMLEWIADAPEGPEVSAAELRRFALAELTPQERAALNLDVKDPKSINRLKNEYDQRRRNGLNDPRRRGFPPMGPPR